MFSTADTIVAIATPPGRGGIGVVRLSGPQAVSIACRFTNRERFEARHATLVRVIGEDGASIDHAVVTHFPFPHSYTGDDVVELSTHGSPVVLEALVRAAVRAGARLANPGEFTFRAYLHGRIDLVQAEAVGELIDAVTPLQARVAFDQLDGTLTAQLRDIDRALLDLIAPLEASLDFPEEGYHFIEPGQAATALAGIAASIDTLLADAARGRLIREGMTVAIAGRPNAGKSSLFNRLAGAARAIVTDVAGTTRDLLTERVDIAGVPFTIVDTAGLRQRAGDAIELEGIARAQQAVAGADLLVIVLDRSGAVTEDDRALLETTASRRRVIVASKSDLEAAWDARAMGALEVSSVTGDGFDALRHAIGDAAGAGILRDRAAIANMRHVVLLEKARDTLSRAKHAASAAAAEEFVLADLHEARGFFDEITGARPRDEVLRVIFDRFCIGK
ncbi:MAG: tRNA uridine-5-carboxymethylaminomethyl(34) synthesis GTPase MnmE [Vicinamibacterales bacterium]